MQYFIAYIVSLVLFAAIDITWLMTMGARLYKQTLGDILLPDVNVGPAIAFYLIYPIGLVFFAVLPALRAQAPSQALLNGAVLGFLCYATYELTNFATLRNWTLNITVIDIAYGTLASGAVALAVASLLLYWKG
jgi:uncharacterized membrane protein